MMVLYYILQTAGVEEKPVRNIPFSTSYDPQKQLGDGTWTMKELCVVTEVLADHPNNTTTITTTNKRRNPTTRPSNPKRTPVSTFNRPDLCSAHLPPCSTTSAA